MRIKGLIAVALCLGILCGCRPEGNNTGCPVLPVALVLQSIKLKIVDKTSGADLFLAPASPYKFSDLKATALTGANLMMFADTAQASDRYVEFATYDSQSFTLKLGPLSADTINMEVLVTPARCSETRTLNRVTLDGKLVCSPCTFNQPVTIKKLVP